jgi:hypothetical protein
MFPAGALQPILQTSSLQRSIVECYMLDPGARRSDCRSATKAAASSERLDLVLAAHLDESQ